jgi:Trypsin-like peptidase domain/Tetratricopeptide repeat
MNSAYRLTALLMGTTVMVAQPFNWGKAVAGVAIGKLAPEVTVFIQGENNPDNFGSGVIIGHSGKSYTVLTAAHVVAAADRYTVQINDGVQYTLLQNVRRLPNVDLAIVQFESSSNYSTAQLGNSDQVSLTTAVYVAGFPKPGQNIRVPVLTITNGEIAQVLPANGAVDGYGLAYTNSTRAGMSGGPVFNDVGEVIAIHGRKEGEAGGGATNGAWLNLGIPINRYKAASQGGGSQIASASNNDAQQAAARKAQEQAAQQAAARKAQEQQQQEQAAQQAAAQRKAQEQAAAQQAAAQRKAQEQTQAQQAAAQRKAQEQAAAQRKVQGQGQQTAAAATQQQNPKIAATKALLASTSPFAASVLQPQASNVSTRQVCKEIRINTIVTRKCETEVVNQIPESASVPSPNGAEKYVNSGNASAANGSYQSALSDYNSAIQGNGSLAIAFFNRGLAYYSLGNTQNAIADFSKAADLFRSQGDAQKLQKTQEILQSLTQSNS